MINKTTLMTMLAHLVQNLDFLKFFLEILKFSHQQATQSAYPVSPTTPNPSLFLAKSRGFSCLRLYSSYPQTYTKLQKYTRGASKLILGSVQLSLKTDAVEKTSSCSYGALGGRCCALFRSSSHVPLSDPHCI